MTSCRRGRTEVKYLVAAIILTFMALHDLASSMAMAASKPKSAAEIALYQGSEREKILVEGAKKEGNLTLYVASRVLREQVSQAFEKKYPFIKVSVWEGEPGLLTRRVLEESAARQFRTDAVDSSESMPILHRNGIFQEFSTPDADFYPDEGKKKGKSGIYYMIERENYNSLGFNTDLVSPSEAPRNYHDLLDPKWKGRLAISTSSLGIRLIGNMLDALGMEYIEKLSRQNVKVYNLEAGALGTLVISGEVPLSPNITQHTIITAKKKGAHVEWRPLEPVLTNPASFGINVNAQHPYAALLFADFLFSKEGQMAVLSGGQNSPRKDMAGLETKFKKSYMVERYEIEEYEKKFSEWEGLMKRLFMGKR